MDVLALLLVTVVAAVALGAPAEADEGASAREWVDAAFLGRAPADTPPPAGLEVRRQDHGEFRLRRSVLDTPLRLGEKGYERGLGTHSVSEIVVRLPGPGREFTADAGIDNNHDTAGTRGSVVFTVEVGGKERFRSGVRRGSDGPLPVRVALEGAREITLRVLDAGDGPSHDQSDWADAAATLESGERVWLDDLPLYQSRVSIGIPFSFVYGGKPSRELLPGWRRTQATETPAEGTTRHRVIYADPATRLEVTCEVTLFAGFPAADWVLRFRNAGDADTPILEQVLPLDLAVALPAKAAATLHHARGSSCAPSDFEPLETGLAPGADVRLAPVGGRSSNGTFPFFNLSWGHGGVVGGIGWSGQWALGARRSAEGDLALQAGQQRIHLRLRPGEEIRTPRVLLVFWSGDRLRGHNAFRRLIYRHYTPLLGGKKPLPPVQCNSWFPVGDDGGRADAANQIALLEAYAPIGIEYLVMDAGWYAPRGVGWPQVGTWEPDREKFPQGLRPVGEASKRTGIRFGMWFEPERVTEGSQLDREHPDWLLRVEGSPNRLLNLGHPEAQQWLIDLICRYVEEVPLGYYRQDFNMEPLPYWEKADAPDRVGMAEIRHVEGLYRVWDALMARHPELMVEGCASGGRRIDLESIRRCHTYWKTDLYGNHTANQCHVYGANLYLPGNYLNTPLFDLDTGAYGLRSTFGGAICLGWDPRAQKEGPYPRGAFHRELAAAQVGEFKALRHLAIGDFYPLTEYTLGRKEWVAYQFHREDLGEGMVLCFRRDGSIYVAADLALKGLEPDREYVLRFAEGGGERMATGRELAAGRRVAIDGAPGSALITYREKSRK